MSKAEKLFGKLTAGRNDANFSFDDLCTLLNKLGYTARKTKGSHICRSRRKDRWLSTGNCACLA